jgi:hypothetical protein
VSRFIYSYAECHYAECPISFIRMLNVIMLSVDMLNVVMLSVVEPLNKLECLSPARFFTVELINVIFLALTHK